jgi:hypothetical protein
VASELFRQLHRHETDVAAVLGSTRGAFSAYEVRASYVEVYKGQLYDLLAESGRTVVASSASMGGKTQVREGGWV